MLFQTHLHFDTTSQLSLNSGGHLNTPSTSKPKHIQSDGFLNAPYFDTYCYMLTQLDFRRSSRHAFGIRAETNWFIQIPFMSLHRQGFRRPSRAPLTFQTNLARSNRAAKVNSVKSPVVYTTHNLLGKIIEHLSFSLLMCWIGYHLVPEQIGTNYSPSKIIFICTVSSWIYCQSNKPGKDRHCGKRDCCSRMMIAPNVEVRPMRPMANRRKRKSHGLPCADWQFTLRGC